MASKLVPIAVFVFDLMAFGMAVAAEQTRSTATIQGDSEVMHNYCVYESDVATAFGVGSFLFLMASQVLIMAASGCFCCGKSISHSGYKACTAILFLFCWVFFIIAEVFLLAGSVRNADQTKYRTIFSGNPPSCPIVRKGVFAVGAAFALLTAIVSEFYYICYSRASDNKY